MRLILTFGQKEFTSKLAKWNQETAQVGNTVQRLIDEGKFLYHACNEQEVYQIQDTEAQAYAQIKEFREVCQKSQDQQSIDFVRQVQVW